MNGVPVATTRVERMRRHAQLQEVEEWLRSNDGRLEDIFGLWTQGKRSSGWVAERLIDEGFLPFVPAPTSTREETP